MILRLLLVFAVSTAAGNGSIVMAMEFDPVVNSDAVVVSSNARFTVLTPAVIRMEWSPTGAFEDRASLVFVNRHLSVPTFTSERDSNRLTIKTNSLTLRYTEDNQPFSKTNLFITLTLNGKPVTWAPGTENKGNLGGTYRTLDTISGGVPLPPGLLSRDGWTLIDDSRRLLFDRSPKEEGKSAVVGPQTDWPWATPRGEERALDWYFFGHGHDYKQALRDFTRLAGNVPLPPRFVFGAWWSRYWAYSDAELKQLVRDFDAHNVPLDVLVIDMDWHLKGWTGYTWDPKYFPDPDGFLKWAHEQGLRATLNLHPASGVKKHEKAFPAFARAMGLDPRTTDQVPFDCTDPRYVDAYFKHLHHPLERQGVDFWWIDWQQGEKTKTEGLDPLWWLNYLHWTDMERNPERRGKRPMMFSRWGGLGNHRYQIGFSGDTYCDWPSLAFQPYFTSTAGNVCYPYWSHDIGGHQPGPVEPELYARWIQWGALSPILRTHTTKNPNAERRIWKFPEEVFHAARKAFQLRYELIPYIYTAARQCHDTAVPLCRPLYYEWSELDEAYRYTGEYLFGDDLLVAPVTKPANPLSGCAEVRVWLPPGEWTNWFTGRTYAGPAIVPLQVPPDEIPLFARAGAVIPTQPTMRRTNEKPVDPLILHIWPGESGGTRVYEDDNETVGYRHGACAWTPVSHKLINGVRHVTIGPVEGSYPEMPKERAYEIHLRDVWPAAEVTLLKNNQAIPRLESKSDNGWHYNANALSTVIRLPAESVDQRIELRVVPGRPAAEETLLHTGTRGHINRLEETVHLLRESGFTKPDALAELRKLINQHESPRHLSVAMRQLGEGLLKAIAVSDLDQAETNRALVRLLGLQCNLDVVAAGDGKNNLNVTGIITMSPPAGLLSTASGRLELLSPPHWSIQGRTTWSSPNLGKEKQVLVSAMLAPDGLPQTSVLRSKFVLGPDDLRLELHGRQVLLPSINRWWLVGPFPAKFEGSLDKVFPPEQQIDLKATYDIGDGKRIGWKKVERELTPTTDLTAEFFVNLLDVFDRHNENAVTYALTRLHAPEDTEAVLAVGSDDGVAIWLNGEEVHRHQVGRAYQSKEDRVLVQLKKGTNTLLVKISQGAGGWGFCVHVDTPDGKPLTAVTAHLHP